MLDRLLENYKAFIDGRTRAHDAYVAGLKELGENYSGALLTDKIKTFEKAYDAAQSGLQSEYVPELKAELAEGRDAVLRAMTQPISRSLKALPLSDADKASVLQMAKVSNAARRLVVELLGLTEDDLPPSGDRVLENIAFLEKLIMASVDHPSSTSFVRLLVQGNLISKIQAEATAFVSAYSATV